MQPTPLRTFARYAGPLGRRASLMLMIGASLLLARPAHADCFDEAAAYEHVNPNLLRAIAWQESHNQPAATHTNDNGSVDYGLMQINSVHMPALAQYGITLTTLMQPCANVYIGAWHLHRMMGHYDNLWQAVGAYHSATPALRDEYGQQIYAILASWKQTGDLPPLPENFSAATAGSVDNPQARAAPAIRKPRQQSGVLIYRGTTLDTNRIHRPMK